jgi:hypothetical protein
MCDGFTRLFDDECQLGSRIGVSKRQRRSRRLLRQAIAAWHVAKDLFEQESG